MPISFRASATASPSLPVGLAENAKLPRAGTLSVLVPIVAAAPGLNIRRLPGRRRQPHGAGACGECVGDSRQFVAVYDSNLVHWRNSTRHYYRWSDPTRLAQPIAQRRLSISAPRNQVQDIPIELDELIRASACAMVCIG